MLIALMALASPQVAIVTMEIISSMEMLAIPTPTSRMTTVFEKTLLPTAVAHCYLSETMLASFVGQLSVNKNADLARSVKCCMAV